MEIKQLYEENEFDVFLGLGWNNWLRVRTNRDKTVDVLGKSEHINVTPKLLELIWYKSRATEAPYPRHGKPYDKRI